MERFTGQDIPVELYKMRRLPPEKRPMLSIAVSGPDDTVTRFGCMKLNSFVSVLDEKGQIKQIVANFCSESNPPTLRFIWPPSDKGGIVSLDVCKRSKKTVGKRIQEFLDRLPECTSLSSSSTDDNNPEPA